MFPMRSSHTRLAVATVACGTVTGLGGVGYYLFSTRVFSFLLNRVPWPWIALVPAAGFLLVGLLLKRFPGARIGGMREVRLSLGRIKEPVPMVRGLNYVLSCVGLAFGGSAGSEGPVAQLGALAGNRVGRFFRLSDAELQTVMRAAVAAGTAALFRSPVGGVLVTIELFGARLNRHLLPVAGAAGLGMLVRVAIRGNEYPLAPPGPFDPLPPFTLFVLLPILGALAAVTGRIFLWIWYRGKTVFPERWSLLLRVTLGGAIVGSVGIWFPQVLGGGYPVIRSAMDGGISWQLFCVLCVLKMFATSISLGSGAVGGVFAPVFVIGGLFGGAFGYGIHAIAPWAIPQGGLFVMLGAMMVFGCVVKSKWAGLVIFADLSGSYMDVLVPSLIAGGVAHLISKRLNPKSIYAD
jgi:CIC family chloride channel protein